jgi:hypothetical protein
MRIASGHAGAEEESDDYTAGNRHEPTCPTVRLGVFHKEREMWANQKDH